MAQYDTQYTTIPEPAPPRRKLWPLAGVFWIDLAIIFILIVLVNVVAIAYILARASQTGLINLADNTSILRLLQDQATVNRLLGAGTFVFLLIQSLIFMGIPILRVAVLRHEPLAEIGFQAHHPMRLIALGAGLGVLTLIGSSLLGSFFSAQGIEQNQAEQFVEQFSLLRGAYVTQALFFLFGGILAPISEEVLFRGYAFNAIRQTFRSKRWGVPLAYLLSALLFTLPHLIEVTQGAIALLIPLFLIGLALAWALHRTGSLIPGIIAHVMNNSVALAALLLCVNNVSRCPKL